MAEPLLDALAERIARGERIGEIEFTRLGEETSSPQMAEGLLLLSRISDYHSQLLVESERTIEESSVDAPERWGRLELRQRLGRGGFGDVYRAYDPDLQREVALKLFHEDRMSDESAASELLAEARQLAKLKHQNVVSVYGVETHDGRSGYWMELVEGRTLEAQLEADGPLGADEARQMGLALCRAVAAVHAQGLVHRDIKTTNVMRERGGRLVLMDFGTVVDAEFTDPGRVSGTPAYMAPELLDGRPPSVQSDVFSLGVLLFRLSTGSYPREARDLSELRRMDARGQRKRLRDLRPDLPSEFCEVVERALSADPEERFASAGELELALAGSHRRGPSNFMMRRAAMVAVGAVLLMLYFVLRGGGPSMVADARVYTLQSGAATLIGDQSAVSVGSALWMELRPSREAHVYVLNRDAAGEVNLLYPLPGYDSQNPLAAEINHELPGRRDGVRKAWLISSESGHEEILIVASPKPLDAFEESLRSLPAAGSDAERPALALGSSQVRELERGISGTLDLPEARPSDPAANSVFSAAERLGSTPTESGEIWVRRITLRHE